jgi:excisionase family DNA binding protein
MHSVSKAAQLLGVSPSLIRKLIRNRQIAFVRIGHCVRIPQRGIDALILAGTATCSSSSRSTGAESWEAQ